MLLKTAYKMKPPVSARLNTGHPLADKLIACYLLNEGSGVKAFDATYYKNHGTLAGGATLVTGKFGRAKKFDGTDGRIEVGDHGAFDVTAVSMSGWVNLDSGWSETGYVIAKMEDYTAAGEVSYGLAIDSKRLIILVMSEDGDDIVVEYSDDAISASVWHHVVGTYNGAGSYKIYVDGSLVDSDGKGAATGEIYAGTGRVTLGARYDLGDTAYKILFNGIIDNVMIWGRALTQSEIAKLYVSPFCMFEKRQRPIVGVTQ